MTTEAQISFGHALKAQRLARGLGLRHLAALSNLSPSYLSRLEHDHSPAPKARVLRRLAGGLNIDVEVLLAAAGIIPDFVVSIVRSRPRAMQSLLTLIAPMTDDEVDDLCDEVQRRLAKMPASRLAPRRIDSERLAIGFPSTVR
jgi:transcriptional regulator with XRE-family HTH domain